MAPATLDPVVDESFDLDALHRAWHGPDPGGHPAQTAANGVQLTITRNTKGDFQDRQVFLWVDDEPWGKIRYGRPVTREIAPGPHRVRVFNTLFSHTLAFTAVPGEHVRLRCTNGMPSAGWLMLIIWHATCLVVRLEREL